MHAHALLESLPPETDPVRRGWQVLLAMAWSMLPAATVDELGAFAIALAGRSMDPVDPAVVEQVALAMLLARSEGAAQ